jgi:phage shock protein PspC (stress-responsive transcriptional regulator)
VGSPAPVPSAPSRSSRPRKGGPNTTALLAVVNGALAGVGSVYLTTDSILVTLIAALSAVVLGSFVLFVR